MKKAPKIPNTVETPEPNRDAPFAYADYPDTTVGPFLDPDVNLQELFEQCNQELALQQTKRDQLITFYLTIFGLLATFLFSQEEKARTVQAVVCAGLFVVGYMWTTVILRYRIYKEAYWLCCRTLTSLFSVDHSMINKGLVQHYFFNSMRKSICDIAEPNTYHVSLWRSIKKNRTSAEYLMYMTLVLLSGLCGCMSLTMILRPLALGWILYAVAGLLLAVLLVVKTIQYNKALIDFYAVTRDKKNKSFNKVFEKAWFLHLFH